MKKSILVAFLFCFNSTIANADAYVTNKPVVCVPTKTILETLQKEHEELPIMLGFDSDNTSKYSLFVNRKTGTWTFIQFNNEDACMLGFGEKARVFIGKDV